MQGFSLKAKSSGTKPIRQNVFSGKSNAFNDIEHEDEQLGQKRVVKEINQGTSSVNPPKPKDDLVIVPEPNKNWFSAKGKRSVYIPEKKDALKQEYEETSGHSMSYGLNVIQRPEGRRGETNEQNDEKSNEQTNEPPNEQSNEPSDKQPTIASHSHIQPLSEDQQYAEDIAQRPDQPDMDAYKRVPVESFGAALLRGMGWKGTSDLEDDEVDKTVISLEKKRPAYMGLGAKPANGHSREKMPKKQDMSYIPLVKRDVRTGEIIEENGSGGDGDRRDGNNRGSRGNDSRGHWTGRRDRNRSRSRSPERYARESRYRPRNNYESRDHGRRRYGERD